MDDQDDFVNCGSTTPQPTSDMIFMKVPEQYAPSIEMVKKFLREKKLTEDRLNQSLLRILRLKYKRGLFGKKTFSARKVLSTIGCSEHAAVAGRVAKDAVLVMKNTGGTLPLRIKSGGSVLAVVPRDMHVVLSNDSTLSHDMLPQALRRHYRNVQQIVVDETPTKYQAYEAVGRAKNADAVIFGIYSAGASDALLELLKEIAGLGNPVIAVITNSPFWMTRLPDKVNGAVCTFGISTFSFNAAADAIAGKANATARLPVALNRQFSAGFSIAARKGK